MAKGVLGNDPFQRGAAQRPSESKAASTVTAAPEQKKATAAPPPAKKAAPARAAKKAPAQKPVQSKPAPNKPAARSAAPKPVESRPASKPAAGTRGKKAESAKGKTPSLEATSRRSEVIAPSEAASATSAGRTSPIEARETPPQPETRLPPEVATVAGTASGAPVAPPPSPASTPAGAEVRAISEEPAKPREPADARPSAAKPSAAEEAEVDLLERAAEALSAAEALRELERTIGEPLPTGPVSMPGFEDAAATPVAGTVVVEVIDTSHDEYAPGSEAEAVEEARIEVEVEAALAPVPPAASTTTRDIFFTSDSPGAESPRLGARLSGLMSLAKEVAFHALASERLGKTLGSAQGVLSAALAGIGVGGGTAIDEYGKDAELGGVLHPVLDFLYERYWRVSVQGASHVPGGPVLLVANHSGALPFDGPMLQQALSRERPDLQEARWLAEDQVFYAPMLGTLMNRLGAVRACPENALRLLDELRPVIVFPEGIQGLGKPFAQRYQLKRFGRGGFVKLALRTGAPIVPVAIVGAEETAPLFGKIPARFLGIPYLPVTPPPLPARWTIRFGEPIGMGELPPEAAEDMSQVQRLTERTRESIQGMLQALLKERRSVFAG
ncbi:1-acyl-sn-glycerol-3-phosphate acyltransferase [Archangium violaceum]|uniref:lysophospholipid acyltransferase family protein n=1 Tax=Archangium violaceum TaxID=83451 RepID=UPI00193BB09E|nr:lysophospholipid acyltransferase family protein [Archangium violaceum]QRK05848.1 1-acyl-sn-glycerol-3-phosphate acyltransferase [Archangium violaceum]